MCEPESSIGGGQSRLGRRPALERKALLKANEGHTLIGNDSFNEDTPPS